MINVPPVAKIIEQNNRSPAKQRILMTTKPADATASFADYLTAATEEILAPLVIRVEDERYENHNSKKKTGGK